MKRYLALALFPLVLPLCQAAPADVWYHDADYSGLAIACQAAAAAGATLTIGRLWVVTGLQKCEADILFISGGKIQTAANSSLMLGGTLTAPPGQWIFDVRAPRSSIAAEKTALLNTVYPQWFGAALDGSTDDSAEMQSAVDFFGTASSIRGGRLYISGPMAIAHNVLFQGKSMEVAGCGWGDQNANPKGCYVKWNAASSSSTVDMFTVTCSEGMWMHDLRFVGNPRYPPQSAVGLKSSECTGGFRAANQFNTFERIAIGNYPISDNSPNQFVNGVYYYGNNANDDSTVWNTLFITNAGTGINIGNQQNVLQTFNNVALTFESLAGIALAAGGNFSNLSFGGNPLDIKFQLSLNRSQIYGLVNIFGMSSEGSLRFIDFGSNVGYPHVNIYNGQWGFGNGNVPVDDGACGPGTGGYAHCSKIIKAAGQLVDFQTHNFNIIGGSTAAGHQWIADFSNPSLGAYPVNLDWGGDVASNVDVSGNFLLGSAATGSGNWNQHFKLNNYTGNGPGERWEYYGGDFLGNRPWFIPVAGVNMDPRDFFRTQKCVGVCNVDFASGAIQSILLTGDIAVLNLLNAVPGQGQYSITMCQDGVGGHTSSPPSNVGVGGWGFGSMSMAAHTCSQQLFSYTGTGGVRSNSINADSAIRTGLAP